jgi:hypothetical protein
VRQRIVPLGYRVDRFGNTRSTTGNEFNISSVNVGATTPVTVQGSDLVNLTDQFAPGQFKAMSDAEKLSAPSFQTMRSGVRLGLIDGLIGGAGVERTVQYEVKIARDVAANDVAGRAAGPATTEDKATAIDEGSAGLVIVNPGPTTPTTPILSDQLFRRLARTGAVGRTARSYEQRRPSRKAPDQIFWDDDTYAVVRTRDLMPHVMTAFANEAAATQYLTDTIASSPTLTGELQVIPSYQLPASVSSNVAFA